MPRLGNSRPATEGRRAQDDPRICPQDGIYSGMTKRLAITDGTFADVAGAPKGKRKN